jgi:hypothetical protein
MAIKGEYCVAGHNLNLLLRLPLSQPNMLLMLSTHSKIQFYEIYDKIIVIKINGLQQGHREEQSTYVVLNCGKLIRIKFVQFLTALYEICIFHDGENVDHGLLGCDTA